VSYLHGVRIASMEGLVGLADAVMASLIAPDCA